MVLLLKNGSIASSSFDGTINIYDKDLNFICSTNKQNENVSSMIELDSNYLISCSFDKSIRKFHINNSRIDDNNKFNNSQIKPIPVVNKQQPTESLIPENKDNNIVFKSWYGISFSTTCPNTPCTSTPGVSINCRNGDIYTKGVVYEAGTALSNKYQAKGNYAAASHTTDKVSHITAAERQKWNNNSLDN